MPTPDFTTGQVTFRNGRLFDGRRVLDGHAIRFEDGRTTALAPEAEVPEDGRTVDLAGDILAPGYVDLQVNGGGGVMFNDDPSVDTLRRIAEAHFALGTRLLLPTLITDTAEKTESAVAAAIEATRLGLRGVAGLHLEGPHISVARKGAHDPGLIRPMGAQDLERLLAAKDALPVLMVTVAPESVTEAQVSALAGAGVLVSLGHSDAGFDTCRRHFAAGARCATHLFNAMSQLGSREPGLVGAALATGDVSAGLIADGVHVHPEAMRAAWAAKAGPGRFYLVSDAMTVAGTDLAQFDLGGRNVRREGGRLTLDDGTLAGADLDLTTALRVLTVSAGVPLDQALQAATTVPAEIIGRPGAELHPRHWNIGNVIRIASDLSGVVSLG